MIWILLLIYQLKHFVADYPLQTPYMLRKFLPGWDFVKPLSAHAGVHAGFTFLIGVVALAWTPGGLVYAAGLAAFDFIVHFVVDRIKASPAMLGKYKALSAREFPDVARDASGGYKTYDQDTVIVPEGRVREARLKLKHNTYFWWALGWDQAMHHLTHYAIIYFIITRGGYV